MFDTPRAAKSAAKDWTDMMYREGACIRSVDCPTSADSWPSGDHWNAMVEWYEYNAETGRPQFHRQHLTPADIERLNEYERERLDQKKKELA